MTPVPVSSSSSFSPISSSSPSSASATPCIAARSSNRLLKQADHRSASCVSAARHDGQGMGSISRRRDHFAVSQKCLTSALMILLLSACDAQSSPSSSFSSSSSSSSTTDQVTRNENFLHETLDESRSPITAVFSTTNVSINFTHIAFDATSDQLFVGATNWLYQLNANLSADQQVRTGPVEDSPNCSPTDCSGVDSSLIRVTKNTNKVLVIDPSSRMLISCGSVHQGACRRHSLADIGNMEPLVGVPVAANDENSSTIAFVSPVNYGNSVSSVLFVGASNSRQGPYRDVVPAISSRSLEPGPGLFSIIEKSFTEIARVDISYHLRDYFLVKYITGFHSGDFVYFATVQKKSHFRALEEWGFASRLARVCASDAGFHTYTETTISCIGPDGTDYSLLQDATTAKVDPELARSLGMDVNEEALIGVFAKARDHSISPSGSSAVCIFPMSEIERGFLENIHMCFNGSVLTRNMDYIAGNIQDCPQAGNTGNVVNFCSETLKLNGTIPVVQLSAITYPNTTLTSIVLISDAERTTAFAGTSSGHVKKISVGRSSAEEVDDIVIDEGHAVLPDMFADRTQDSIYAASAYKIVKLSTNISRNKSQVPSLQLHKPTERRHQVPRTFQYKPIQLPDIVIRPETRTKQPIPTHVVHQSSPTRQPDGKKLMQSIGRGGMQRSPASDLNGARVAVPVGKNSDANEEMESKEISPLILILLPAAVGGALMALVLITLINYKRKGSSGSTLSRDHHLIWSSSDPELKMPPPLIPSTVRPLIPASAKPLFSSNPYDKTSDRDLSPTDSQVYAIYSEINDMNDDRREKGDGRSVGIPLNNRQSHPSQHHALSPRQHAHKQLTNNAGRGHESSTLIPNSSTNQVTRIPAYPPFFTFNTIGRSRDKDNPYIFQHDTMGRPPDNAAATSIFSLNGSRDIGSFFHRQLDH